MQKISPVSLRAVRAFIAVARHSSIKLAATELGLTASAISHQIKVLEGQLQTALFTRSNNALSLTEAGRLLKEEAGAGVAAIDKAVERVMRGANALTIRVGVTFAIRWFIPVLARFKARYPEASIRVETTTGDDGKGLEDADLCILYRPHGVDLGKGEEPILRDVCRPVAAPSLFNARGAGSAPFQGGEDISSIPALSCAAGDWDWKLWSQEAGIDFNLLRFGENFDIDDTALRAAVAGMGMVLAPPLMTRIEVEQGGLAPVPGLKVVEMGRYVMLSGPRNDRIIRQFRKWLIEEITADAGEDMVPIQAELP